MDPITITALATQVVAALTPLFSKAGEAFAGKLGEDVYAAFGQTLGGRYLSVFFIYKPARMTAVIISARDMSDKERKAYGRK